MRAKNPKVLNNVVASTMPRHVAMWVSWRIFFYSSSKCQSRFSFIGVFSNVGKVSPRLMNKSTLSLAGLPYAKRTIWALTTHDSIVTYVQTLI